jgi:LPS-assembly protein
MRKIFLSLFIAFLLPHAIFAQDLVNIKADHLKLSEEEDGITASGSVEVVFRKATIKADRVFIDEKNDIVTAEGNVSIIMDKDSSSSKYLVYNISSEALDEIGFSTKLSPKSMKGHVYVFSERVYQKNEIASGESGVMTTCERELPHFYLTADKFKITSGEKMEGRNVVFHVGNLPVLWLPYFYFDPEMKQSENFSFGQNQVEGTFVKTRWEHAWGGLLFDFMQNKGFGYGIQYGLSAIGAGSL